MKYTSFATFNRSVVVKLDLEGMKIPDLSPEEYEDWLTFPVNVYSALRIPSTDDKWKIRMDIVNMFIASLSEKDQQNLAKNLIFINATIHTHSEELSMDTKKIPEVNQELSGLILKLNEESNIIPQIRVFVKKHIHPEIVPSRGKRAQDSRASTFYPDEELELISLTMVCKLLFPVFGLYMEVLKLIIETSSKDRHCGTIIGKLLNDNFSEIMEKTYQYAKKPILNEPKSNPVYDIVGHSSEVLLSSVMDKIVVRNLVNAKLEPGVPKILNYISSSNKNYAQYSTNTKVNKWQPKSPNYTSYEGDEGNESNLEAKILQSSKYPSSVAIHCRTHATTLTRNLIINKDYDLKEFLNLTRYYTENPFQITKLTISLLCKLYGDEFGGSRGIRYLRYNEIRGLICIVILECLERGLANLIPILAPSRTTRDNPEVRGDMSLLIHKNYMQHPSYITCKEYYSSSVTDGATKWDEEFDKNVHDYTDDAFQYNVPIALQGGAGDINGSELILSNEALGEMCDLILTRLVRYTNPTSNIETETVPA